MRENGTDTHSQWQSFPDRFTVRKRNTTHGHFPAQHDRAQYSTPRYEPIIVGTFIHATYGLANEFENRVAQSAYHARPDRHGHEYGRLYGYHQ